MSSNQACVTMVFAFLVFFHEWISKHMILERFLTYSVLRGQTRWLFLTTFWKNIGSKDTAGSYGHLALSPVPLSICSLVNCMFALGRRLPLRPILQGGCRLALFWPPLSQLAVAVGGGRVFSGRTLSGSWALEIFVSCLFLQVSFNICSCSIYIFDIITYVFQTLFTELYIH